MSLAQELAPMTPESIKRINDADGEIWEGFWESTRKKAVSKKPHNAGQAKENAFKTLNEMKPGEWYSITSLCFFFCKVTVERQMRYLSSIGRVHVQTIKRQGMSSFYQFKRIS